MTHTVLVALLTGLVCLASDAAEAGGTGGELTVDPPGARPDRLVGIRGTRGEHLTAEFSVDSAQSWHPATICNSDEIHDWQRSGAKVWNAGTLKGFVAKGTGDCLWQYFFDVAMPRNTVLLRLRSEKRDSTVLLREVDLSSASDVLVIDRRHVARLAGGALPSPWRLELASGGKSGRTSLVCDDELAPPLTLKLNLRGWYRVYVGQEKMASFFLKFSKEPMQYEVPDFYGKAGSWYDRPMREYYLRSADMTGQDLVLAPGGTMYPKPAGVHHIRFVPMTAAEVAKWREFRALVDRTGRPFAAYVEQCSAAFYFPETVRMAEYTRGEMWKHKLRGATDAYVHVIRIGMTAWYHSDVVGRCVFKEGEASEGWLKWTAWMEQGDPLAVAIKEGRAAGLKVFADVGMNRTHINNPKEHYRVTTEARPLANRDWLCKGTTYFLDYRHPGVRDYVVKIVREILMKYGPDGVHLDYLRFPYRYAFDEASLIDVGKRIHEARLEAQEKWGHRILIAARIPSYLAQRNKPWDKAYAGDHAEFVAALKVWADDSHVDRVMPASMGFTSKLSLTRYHAAIQGSQVELWGNLYGHSRSGSYAESPALARRWAREGMNGGLFFYKATHALDLEHLIWYLRMIDRPDLEIMP